MLIDVFIPTLYRSHNLQRVIDSFYDTSPDYASLLFMCPEDDEATINILDKNRVAFFTDKGDMRYVTRIQYIYDHTNCDWFLTGSDDIIFHKGWLDAAKPHMNKYSVISFDDMCNPNLLGTNFLVKRKYIQEQSGVLDQENTVFHGGYIHNFCDNELVIIAMKRGQFIQCDGKIEHDHPMRKNWQNWDAVYQIARDHWDQDAELFNFRAKVFGF